MGLGSYWGEVIEVLRQIIPIYDKVNKYISLGKDTEHRNRGIKGRVNPGDSILDAGSGFGNMSRTAEKICGGNLTITLYDPLVPMLKNTSTYFQKPQTCRAESLSTYRSRTGSLTQSCADTRCGMQ